MLFDLLGAETTPFSVSVHDTVRTAVETDWFLFAITLAGTLASAAVAIFTGILAARTSALARETKRMADKTAALAEETLTSVNLARTGNALADQHHQESQSPIITLSDMRFFLDDAKSRQDGHLVVRIGFSIANLGFGPALNVDVAFKLDSGTLTVPVSLRPLSVGETRKIDFNVSVEGEPPTRTAPVDRWLVIATYDNVFGGHRKTEYDMRGSVGGTFGRANTITFSPQSVITRTDAPAVVSTADHSESPVAPPEGSDPTG